MNQGNVEELMRRCLELARSGLGKVSPNPLVGAVLVKDGQIVSEGAHEVFGGPHAEVNAITRASGNLANSELFVNLEPCCHHGKTPPCTDLIIQKQIKNVYCAIEDPNPQIAGKGVRALQSAGLTVIQGLLSDPARFVNKRFIWHHTKSRPYIILKWAESADGYMAKADGSSKWISNNASRTIVHHWRSQEDAVLVGTNTALIDDPVLTVRHVAGRNPVRILIDSRLKVPKTAQILNSAATTLIFNSSLDSVEGQRHFKKVSAWPDLWAKIMESCLERDILSVVVEGGARVLNDLISLNLWDEARVFVSNTNLRNGLLAPKLSLRALVNYELVDQQTTSADNLSIYYNWDTKLKDFPKDPYEIQ